MEDYGSVPKYDTDTSDATRHRQATRRLEEQARRSRQEGMKSLASRGVMGSGASARMEEQLQRGVMQGSSDAATNIALKRQEFDEQQDVASRGREHETTMQTSRLTAAEEAQVRDLTWKSNELKAKLRDATANRDHEKIMQYRGMIQETDMQIRGFDENAKRRGWETGEREGTQDWTTGERREGQDWTSFENIRQQQHELETQGNELSLKYTDLYEKINLAKEQGDQKVYLALMGQAQELEVQMRDIKGQQDILTQQQEGQMGRDEFGAVTDLGSQVVGLEGEAMLNAQGAAIDAAFENLSRNWDLISMGREHELSTEDRTAMENFEKMMWEWNRNEERYSSNRDWGRTNELLDRQEDGGGDGHSFNPLSLDPRNWNPF